jgi:hypothetical protein
MTDEEICREYRLSKYPSKQIKILAEENDCSAQTIRNILRAAGLDLSRGRPPGPKAAASSMPLSEFQAALQSTFGAALQSELADKPEPDASWPPLPPAPQGAGDCPEDGGAGATEQEGSNVDLSGFTPVQGPMAGPSSPPSAEGRIGEEREEPNPTPDAALSASEVSPFPAEARLEEANAGAQLHWISGKDLSRMWHILGRLQGVLEASAEAGRPGEVMKDACDELESLLCYVDTSVLDHK